MVVGVSAAENRGELIMQTAADNVDDVRPSVVVIGNFSHEGLSAKIESLGFQVINRNLRSTSRNWEKILLLLEDLSRDDRLASVFLYLPTTTLLQVSNPTYDEVRPRLLAALAKTRSVAFVHEDNLQGSVEPFPWQIRNGWSEAFDDDEIPWLSEEDEELRASSASLPTAEEWRVEHAEEIARGLRFLETLTDINVEVAPFRKRSDVTIRMFQMLEESQAGIFLRLYVPHGRYQSEQFEDFLTLFSRYLRDVEKKEFSVDVQRTARGTTYVFKGRGEVSDVGELQLATRRFEDFLSLSQMDPSAAEAVLERSGVERASAAFIVAKYARSIRRLGLEMKHEFERRRLVLSQAFEAELLDSTESQVLPAPDLGRPSSLFSIVGNSAPVTITIAGQVSDHARLQIAQIVDGSVTYSNEDKLLLARIELIDDKIEALQLRSELDILKDPATDPEQRRTAVQKLKGFLYKGSKYVGKKIDEIGTQVLINYLDRLISGGGQ